MPARPCNKALLRALRPTPPCGAASHGGAALPRVTAPANVRAPMSVRDLGYRAYEGPRLPASHNTWVMIRHSLRRAWASWLVKLPIFFCLGTTIVLGIWYI